MYCIILKTFGFWVFFCFFFFNILIWSSWIFNNIHLHPFFLRPYFFLFFLLLFRFERSWTWKSFLNFYHSMSFHVFITFVPHCLISYFRQSTTKTNEANDNNQNKHENLSISTVSYIQTGCALPTVDCTASVPNERASQHTNYQRTK